MPLNPYVGSPAAFMKRPSVAPVLNDGTSGTTGHNFAATLRAGSRIAGVSGGAGDVGPGASASVT